MRGLHGRKLGKGLRRHARMVVRLVTEKEHPPRHPDQAGRAKHEKGHTPAVYDHEPSDDWRGNRVADARERMGDALGESALARGKPDRHGLGGRREGCSFAETEKKAS